MSQRELEEVREVVERVKSNAKEDVEVAVPQVTNACVAAITRFPPVPTSNLESVNFVHQNALWSSVPQWGKVMLELLKVAKVHNTVTEAALISLLPKVSHVSKRTLRNTLRVYRGTGKLFSLLSSPSALPEEVGFGNDNALYSESLLAALDAILVSSGVESGDAILLPDILLPPFSSIPLLLELRGIVPIGYEIEWGVMRVKMDSLRSHQLAHRGGIAPSSHPQIKAIVMLPAVGRFIQNHAEVLECARECGWKSVVVQLPSVVGNPQTPPLRSSRFGEDFTVTCFDSAGLLGGAITIAADSKMAAAAKLHSEMTTRETKEYEHSAHLLLLALSHVLLNTVARFGMDVVVRCVQECVYQLHQLREVYGDDIARIAHQVVQPVLQIIQSKNQPHSPAPRKTLMPIPPNFPTSPVNPSPGTAALGIPLPPSPPTSNLTKVPNSDNDEEQLDNALDRVSYPEYERLIPMNSQLRCMRLVRQLGEADLLQHKVYSMAETLASELRLAVEGKHTDTPSPLMMLTAITNNDQASASSPQGSQRGVEGLFMRPHPLHIQWMVAFSKRQNELSQAHGNALWSFLSALPPYVEVVSAGEPDSRTACVATGGSFLLLRVRCPVLCMRVLRAHGFEASALNPIVYSSKAVRGPQSASEVISVEGSAECKHGVYSHHDPVLIPSMSQTGERGAVAYDSSLFALQALRISFGLTMNQKNRKRLADCITSVLPRAVVESPSEEFHQRVRQTGQQQSLYRSAAIGTTTAESTPALKEPNFSGNVLSQIPLNPIVRSIISKL